MDIDADGSPRALILDPQHGQLQTSLCYPGLEGQNKYINSETIPFFVLPMNFAEQHGLELGDIGAVIYRNRLVFGIYADNGPAHKVGEVSIKLAEELGHAPWKLWQNGETLSTHGGIKTQDIIYLVFPGTKPQQLQPGTLKDTIEKVGTREFLARGGNL